MLRNRAGVRIPRMHSLTTRNGPFNDGFLEFWYNVVLFNGNSETKLQIFVDYTVQELLTKDFNKTLF